MSGVRFDMEGGKRAGRRILLVWLLASVALGACIAGLVLGGGSRALLRIMGQGDGTPHAYRLAIFAIAWLWVTCLLMLSQWPAFVRRHLPFLAVLLLLGFEYLSQVREPHAAGSGDFPVYYQAAVSVSRGEPIQGRAEAQRAPGEELEPGQLYIYPPLLATTLAPLTFLSEDALAGVFRLLNYLGVVLLIVLLYRLLPRYGYSREMAALCILGLLIVNVPLSRTLIYHQVNVLVLDLMLLSLWAFPRKDFASALCLSLAIHLKVYPVLLVIPFLAARQWRWLGWFVVSHLLIVGATSLLTDPRYYVDFAGQIRSLSETGLRNTSVSVFVFNTFRILGLDQPGLERVLSIAGRLGLLAALAAASAGLVRRRAFVRENSDSGLILAGYALLPFFMLVVSPSVWEHHYVLLLLSMPAIATLLRTAGEAWSFLLAYALIFVLPVVELYPYSYLPLVAVVWLTVLLWRLAFQNGRPAAEWFAGGLSGRFTGTPMPGPAAADARG
jgi:hypothetical protein